jgi:biopolymer transport protein ExbB/TolQ
MRLSNWRPENAAAATNGINAILFWGALSAILGLLGQSSGLYNSLNVIAQAQAISPNLVAQGFAESFSTTIIGLTTLVLSAVAWFALNAWKRRVAAPRG